MTRRLPAAHSTATCAQQRHILHKNGAFRQRTLLRPPSSTCPPAGALDSSCCGNNNDLHDSQPTITQLIHAASVPALCLNRALSLTLGSTSGMLDLPTTRDSPKVGYLSDVITSLHLPLCSRSATPPPTALPTAPLTFLYLPVCPPWRSAPFCAPRPAPRFTNVAPPPAASRQPRFITPCPRHPRTALH